MFSGIPVSERMMAMLANYKLSKLFPNNPYVSKDVIELRFSIEIKKKDS